VKPQELVALLQECYRDRLAALERHKAVAVHVSNYDANNTYQYVINREETHLQWLGDAIADLSAALPAAGPGPSVTLDRSKDAWKSAAAEDARAGAAFLAKWRPRIEALSHARNQTMLRLMLGEVQEQTRLIEQVSAGQADVLGHSTVGAGSRGVVAGARWFGD
jgi:hypothetical protein